MVRLPRTWSRFGIAVLASLIPLVMAARSNGEPGGEEFLMLTKGTDIEALGKIGERCRKLIEMSAVFAGRDQIRVTVSIGELSSSPEIGSDGV